MLFTGFVYIASYITSLISVVFPESEGFPTEMVNSFVELGEYVQILDVLLPIGTLFTALTILVSVDIAVLSFKTFKWLFSYLPFVGGRG